MNYLSFDKSLLDKCLIMQIPANTTQNIVFYAN